MSQCDLPCDIVTQALQESASTHRNMMTETRANAQQAHQMVRTASAIAETKQDPLEAAAIEVLLSGQRQGQPGTAT